MSVLHLRAGDFVRMPWKNGGGTTTEIARRPAAGPFDWRVSVADVVEDGPFSRFEGHDRVIVAIEGAGMRLDHPAEGRAVTLGALEPYAFSGDLDTRCSLAGGPLRDLNLMTRRGAATGQIAIVRLAAGARADIPAARAVVVLVITGDAVVAGESIASGEAALVQEEATGAVAGPRGATLALAIVSR